MFRSAGNGLGVRLRRFSYHSTCESELVPPNIAPLEKSHVIIFLRWSGPDWRCSICRDPRRCTALIDRALRMRDLTKQSPPSHGSHRHRQSLRGFFLCQHHGTHEQCLDLASFLLSTPPALQEPELLNRS